MRRVITTLFRWKTVSLAWLFDENGLVQAWTPLADLSGNVGASWHTRLEYVRQSAEGHVMFATPGAGGTLDVHLFEPGLEQMQTFEGVVRLYQQTETPTSYHLTVDVGGTPFENWAMRPGDHKTVLLMPAGREGWYSVLREDGIASLPEGVTGLKPLIRNRLGSSEPKGVAPVRYDMAYGFLVHYQTPEGERYGWASPELSTYTGPVWTEAQIVDSARLESEARGFVDPRLIVAKTDAGYWRAYAEPRIEYGESTLKEPNTFSEHVRRTLWLDGGKRSAAGGGGAAPLSQRVLQREVFTHLARARPDARGPRARAAGSDAENGGARTGLARGVRGAGDGPQPDRCGHLQLPHPPQRAGAGFQLGRR